MFSSGTHGFSPLIRICHDRRGSAAIFGALLLLLMLVMAAFCEQLAMIYVTGLQVQRFADMANLAAATSSAPVSGNTPSATATATAVNLATINGLGNATVTTTAATGGTGAATLTTLVSMTSPLIFGGLWGHATVRAAASATATVNTIAYPDCVASLLGTMQITGSATLTASNCGMASQRDIYLSGSTVNVASAVTAYDAYDEIPEASGAVSLSPATSLFVFKGTTTDTLASHAEVVAIKSHLASLSSWPYTTTLPVSPAYPSVPTGSDRTYTNTVGVAHQTFLHGAMIIANSTINFFGTGSADSGCATPTTTSGDVVLSGTNTLNFDSGCYIFGGYVTVNSGSTTFAINSGATVRFIFEKTVSTSSSSALVFGNATYSFGGDVTTATGGLIVVGTGSKTFGGNIKQNAGNIVFGDGPYYFSGSTILGATGGTQFGTGPFYFWNANISNPSWGAIIFGNGPFYFYNTSLTNGVTGAGWLSFGAGPYYFYSGGITTGYSGSSTGFGAGNMDFYHGGSIRIGAATTFAGGTVSLAGGSLSVTGASLSARASTFALTTGSVTISGPLSALAPTAAAPPYGYQNVAFVLNGGNMTVSSASTQVSGMIYAPGSTVTLSGSATVSAPSGGCLGVAAGYVTLSGNASFTGAPCPGLMPTSTGSQISLSQ